MMFLNQILCMRTGEIEIGFRKKLVETPSLVPFRYLN